MSELFQLIRGLAIMSWRYNTFRGRWTDMPDSTWLCIVLGLLSLAACVLVTWIEYGWLAAAVLPGVWFSAVWLFASDDDGFGLNKRLMSAVFLLTIPFCNTYANLIIPDQICCLLPASSRLVSS